MIRFITRDELIVLHGFILEESGGPTGIRDLPMLESAVAQPLMTFGGQELIKRHDFRVSAQTYQTFLQKLSEIS